VREDCFLFIEDKSSNKLAVFFSAAVAPSFTGFKMLEPYSINKLFIRDPTQSWYGRKIEGFANGPDDIKDEIKKITDKFKPENIIFMGESMGGYAALLFGILLKVGRIIAFGPQMILNSKMPNMPKRHTELKYQNLYEILKEKIPKTKIDIWFGAEDLADVYNISDARYISNIKIFPVKHSPHNVFFYVDGLNLLKPLFDFYIIGKGSMIKYKIEALFFNDIIVNAIKDAIDDFYNDKLNEAKFKLEKLSQFHHKWSGIFIQLGIICVKLKNFDLAEYYYNKALNCSPELDTVYYEKGLLNLYKKEFENAEKNFKKTLELANSDAMTLHKCSIALMKQNKIEEALSIQLKTLSKISGNSEIHYQLGLLYFKLKNFEKALENFMIAYKLNPSKELALKHIINIRTILANVAQKNKDINILSQIGINITSFLNFKNAKIECELPCSLSNANFLKGKIQIGAYSYLSQNCMLHDDIIIGRYCSFGPGVKVSLTEHPTDWFSTHPFQYNGTKLFKNFLHDSIGNSSFEYNCITKIGNDVWIGADVIILKGVEIGDGAIVGAGAVVTKNVEPYSVVVGIPAKHIKFRFAKNIINALIVLKWWDYDIQKFASKLDFSNPEDVMQKIEQAISLGQLERFQPQVVTLTK
jgi:acetyltransferase-like isoleucine patch superfamily enzyme/Flp pilus assembly protein TadD